MKPMIVLWTTKRSGRQAFESSCYVEWTEIYAAGLESMQAQRDTQLRAATVEDSAKAKAALPPSFYYFGRAFDEGEDWPAGDEMDEGVPVSHHNRTTLQSLALKLSSLFLSLFLQLCSPHPCPGEINPRRCRSVESEERLVQLAAPSTQHPGRLPVVHCRTHSTGHRAPQLQTLTLSARQVCNVTFHQISFVASSQK